MIELGVIAWSMGQFTWIIYLKVNKAMCLFLLIKHWRWKKANKVVMYSKTILWSFSLFYDRSCSCNEKLRRHHRHNHHRYNRFQLISLPMYKSIWHDNGYCWMISVIVNKHTVMITANNTTSTYFVYIE